MVGINWHKNCTGPAGADAPPGRRVRPGRRQSGPGAGRRPPRGDARPASARRSRLRGCDGRPSQPRSRPVLPSCFARVAFVAPCFFECSFLSVCRCCSCVVAPQRAFHWAFSSSGSPSVVTPASRSMFRQIISFSLNAGRNFWAWAPRARAHIGISNDWM